MPIISANQKFWSFKTLSWFSLSTKNCSRILSHAIKKLIKQPLLETWNLKIFHFSSLLDKACFHIERWFLIYVNVKGSSVIIGVNCIYIMHNKYCYEIKKIILTLEVWHYRGKLMAKENLTIQSVNAFLGSIPFIYLA